MMSNCEFENMFLTKTAWLIFAVIIAVTCAHSTRCPINEHPAHCVNPCPTPTCSDLSKPSCTFIVCSEGCECNEGYVRIKKPDGACVPISQCKKCLRPDFEYKECGSYCSTTCKGITQDIFCPKICEPGCYCSGKKVLDETTDTCVERNQCHESKGASQERIY